MYPFEISLGYCALDDGYIEERTEQKFDPVIFVQSPKAEHSPESKGKHCSCAIKSRSRSETAEIRRKNYFLNSGHS